MKEIKIGKYNTLVVTKVVDFGLYLDGGDIDAGGWGNILLPARYVPADINIGDEVNVFIYFDSEDRIIATTETPKVSVDEFAFLRVVDVNKAGAFLDWGLPKDLLVPYVQQANRMQTGAYYVVYVYQDDESERVTASAKLSKFLDKTPANYKKNKKLSGLVMAKTDLGYKVIIENAHTGMLYHNEVFTKLNIGQKVNVFINKIRDDGKIDLRLETIKKTELSTLEQQILSRLSANNGILKMNDKTPPEEIYRAFSVSKKNFKRALSHLYKQRLIIIEKDYIKDVKTNY